MVSVSLWVDVKAQSLVQFQTQKGRKYTPAMSPSPSLKLLLAYEEFLRSNSNNQALTLC